MIHAPPVRETPVQTRYQQEVAHATVWSPGLWMGMPTNHVKRDVAIRTMTLPGLGVSHKDHATETLGLTVTRPPTLQEPRWSNRPQPPP